MKVSLTAFAGKYPRVAPNLLPPAGAQHAVNTRITSGSLRALNTPSRVSAPIATAAQSIYWLGAAGSNVLLSWAADVDVAASPVADSEFRVYYTGDGAPKKTNRTLATTGAAPYPATWYFMGTPAPTTAPTLGSTTGSVPAGTYVYVFTYVTQFGATLTEESAPSPPATITLGATGGVTVTFPANPSTTNRNYTLKRVYRTTGTAFQLVAEVPFADASYTDNLAPAAILGDPLLSEDWSPPPSDLKGIVALPSGVMAGFRGNEIWFSEPGYPHAWPARYMQALDAAVVAIKAFGNNIAVATVQHAYVGSGLLPDSFTFQKMSQPEPCISKRSMAADDAGAVYASSNGIVSLGLDGHRVITDGYMTRQDFAAYSPSSIMGVVFEGRYYGFYSIATVGSVSGAFVVSRSENVGVKHLEIDATAATVEPNTAQLYVVERAGNSVLAIDPVGTTPMTYDWKSRLFLLPQPTNFACFKITGRSTTDDQLAYDAAVAAQNAAVVDANTAAFSGDVLSALNGAELNALDVNGSTLQSQVPTVAQTVSVYVYAAGELVHTRDAQFNTIYRLPSGFEYVDWEVRFTGQRELLGFAMATSVQELKSE